ncbi:hypothetical protein [Aequorivita marina]|uniref:anti-sigma factor family protein n=1 Tax=Aequorivita marina TaxID=3073654 RepID=UPI0028764F54|nr:hypothetical protein [Aequorivita sp. S2608]MDS1298461.1 hypothetical protein [Aequorivita sp. S2608]
MKVFLKCEEAANLCDKSQYKEAGPWEKVKLSMHLMMCGLCRKYSKQNVKLTQTIESANIKTMCSEEKKRLKEKLEQELNTPSSL